MTDHMAGEITEEGGVTSWNDCHLYKVRDQRKPETVEDPEPEKLRSEIEPWLTALFQSEHLSLLLGGGMSSATHWLAKSAAGAGMSQIPFSVFQEQIEQAAKESAEKSGRGEPNIEDQIRVSNELIKGLGLYVSSDVYGAKGIRKNLAKFERELADGLTAFANLILESERNIIQSANSELAAECLMSFLISFASRSATRERLNIFTTNYDRVVEYGSELAGIRLIDRFVGTVNPVFRSSRVEVDMHYNPPGIRGEPRYLEGVVHFTKLHGSLDWSVKDGVVRRYALPYGAEGIGTYLDEGSDNLLIYPNAAKDKETSEYPYVELFRDFAASVCRPNSTVVVYGYSFGDEHINRVIVDMLTIPSTHVVIISFDDQGDRIKRFYERVKRPAQISLLVGKHFGDLKTLIDNYLPKPAIDRTTIKMADLLKARGIAAPQSGHGEGEL
ncbi:MAG: SIR2 family protein [Candidatus Thiodiazotropha lotti]|nr:SIR2 family protein [Candidatus Thiodiazotropha lotti]